MNRFVKPETCVLTLKNGDTLVVKKRLNRGEQAEMFSHVSSASGPALGLSAVLAYLMDWQLTDSGAPLLNLSWEEKTLVLNQLDPDDFAEIRDAIVDHIERVQAERDAARKVLAPSPTVAAS